MKNIQVLNTTLAKSYSANNYLLLCMLLLTHYLIFSGLHPSPPLYCLNDVLLFRLRNKNLYLFILIHSFFSHLKNVCASLSYPTLSFLSNSFFSSDQIKLIESILRQNFFFRNLFLTYCVPL